VPALIGTLVQLVGLLPRLSPASQPSSCGSVVGTATEALNKADSEGALYAAS
jgi:hypothetical protein